MLFRYKRETVQTGLGVLKSVKPAQSFVKSSLALEESVLDNLEQQ